MTQRWKLTIEFDGGPFIGWQRQNNGISIQQVLEDAAFKFSGDPVQIITAGRTDSGVHATAIVAHIDLLKPFHPDTVRAALNFHMKPHPVAVLKAEPVEQDFHARFSCKGRSYLYRIINRSASLTLDAGRAWRVSRPLDAEAMHVAAQILIGQHDFTTFRDSQCQAKSPIRTLDVLDVERHGEEIRVTARSRSFLHHQVRNMVGTLKLVGEGRWPIERVRWALEARDRTVGGPTAPPDGLYFTGAEY